MSLADDHVGCSRPGEMAPSVHSYRRWLPRVGCSSHQVPARGQGLLVRSPRLEQATPGRGGHYRRLEVVPSRSKTFVGPAPTHWRCSGQLLGQCIQLSGDRRVRLREPGQKLIDGIAPILPAQPHGEIGITGRCGGVEPAAVGGHEGQQ